MLFLKFLTMSNTITKNNTTNNPKGTNNPITPQQILTTTSPNSISQFHRRNIQKIQNQFIHLLSLNNTPNTQKSLPQRKLEIQKKENIQENEKMLEILEGLSEEINQLQAILFQKSKEPNNRKLIYLSNNQEIEPKYISSNEKYVRIITINNEVIEVKEWVLITPLYEYLLEYLEIIINLSEFPDFIKKEVLLEEFNKKNIKFFFDGNLLIFQYSLITEIFSLAQEINKNINTYCFEKSEKETQLKQFLYTFQKAIYNHMRVLLGATSDEIQLRYFDNIYNPIMTNEKIKEIFFDPYIPNSGL